MTPLRLSSFTALAVVLSLVLGACKSAPKASNRAIGGGPGAIPSADALRSADAGSASTEPAAPASIAARAPDRASSTVAARAPKAGVYTYSQSGTNARGDSYPKTGTLTISSASETAGGARQTHRRAVMSANDERSQTYLFRDDRVALERASRQEYECVLEPAFNVLSLPLRVGSKWSSRSTCNAAGMTVTLDLDGSVLRRERRAVGSVAVDTFVVRTSLTISSPLGSETEEATTWVSQNYKLKVRSEVASSTSTGGSGRFTEELVSLEPKKG